MDNVSPFAIIVALVFVLTLGALMFLFAWNVFVFGVLEFSRSIDIIEAMAGSVAINIVTGAVGQIVKGAVK